MSDPKRTLMRSQHGPLWRESWVRGFPLEQAALKTQSSQGKEEGHGWWCCGSRGDGRKRWPSFCAFSPEPTPRQHPGSRTRGAPSSRHTRPLLIQERRPTTQRMIHGGGRESRVDGHTRRCVWWEDVGARDGKRRTRSTPEIVSFPNQ